MSPQIVQFENLFIIPTLVSIFTAFFILFLIILFNRDSHPKIFENKMLLLTAAPFILFILMWLYMGLKPGDISLVKQTGNSYKGEHQLRPWVDYHFTGEDVENIDFHYTVRKKTPVNSLDFYGEIHLKNNTTIKTITLITVDEKDAPRGFAYCRLLFESLDLLGDTSAPKPPLQYLINRYNYITLTYAVGLFFFFVLSIIRVIFFGSTKAKKILLNSKSPFYKEDHKIPYAAVEEEPVESLRTVRHVGDKIIDSITINGEKIIITIERVRNKYIIFCNNRQYRMAEEIENPHIRQRVKALLRNQQQV